MPNNVGNISSMLGNVQTISNRHPHSIQVILSSFSENWTWTFFESDVE